MTDWVSHFAERLDPWEWELVRKYGVSSPTNDFDAYDAFPAHRWIYDKYKLSRRLNSGVFCSLSPPLVEGDYIVRPRG